MIGSRTGKVLKNAKVNVSFYLLSILLAFFSRKIFLDCLGAEYVGLTGTLTNVLGYLNLAELGFSSALIFNLYKPIFNGEKEKLCDLISFYGYFNRKIGLFIIGAGTVFSFFIPFIFGNSEISLPLVFFAFFVILGSSTCGYFISYRQIMLWADQKSYVFNAIVQTGSILKTLAQIAVTVKTGNYYAWLVIEIAFSLTCCFVVNYRISRIYPWLSCSVKRGALIKNRYKNIMKTTRKVFVHRIKDFLLTQNDQFIVFIFLSLKMVAYYGNYVMIITRLSALVTQLFAGTESGVGNLLAQNEDKQTMKVFWELSAIRYLIAGTICFVLFHLMTPFISVWLGEEYVLDNMVTFILVFNLFIMISRGTVDNFNSALGLYDDTWAAWVELALNLSITIIGGYFWGLYGILLGKTAGLITIVMFWKPYYLFSRGLHKPYFQYWKHTAPYLLTFIVAVIASDSFIDNLVTIDPYESFTWWILSGLIYTIVFSAIYFILITTTCKGGADLVQRVFRRNRLSPA